MSAVRVLAVTGFAVVLGGCASPQARHQLARLQSQVGLLDERVAQLERSGFSASSGGSFGEAAAGTDTWSGAGAASTSKAATSKAASASLKPSTREIQQALKNAGFYQGAVDGKLGPLTREAIREFQRVNGLNPDGVVGKQTWGKLRSYADLSASSGDVNAAEVLK